MPEQLLLERLTENLTRLQLARVRESLLELLKAAQAGQTIQFTTMADLIAKLRVDQTTGRMGRGRRCYTSSLVGVDEVGYTPIDREECHLFYQFVAMRYERISTVITSNKAFEEWSELFHDPVIVTAILERLLHHCTGVNIKGNSYRLKDRLVAQEVMQQN